MLDLQLVLLTTVNNAYSDIFLLGMGVCVCVCDGGRGGELMEVYHQLWILLEHLSEINTCAGLEPIISAILVQCSTN